MFQISYIVALEKIDCLPKTKEVLVIVAWDNIVSDHGIGTE